ncbi:MAG: penicillin-insensitive murein endopeptidase [Myxococcota bacterium]
MALATVTLVGAVWGRASLVHAGSREEGHRLVSRSIGWTSRGLLVGGAEVTESALIRHPEGDQERGWFWGTAELVSLVHHAASRVAEASPGGARLQVGELSRQGGGDIPGHRSHENGRDVDLGFYFTDRGGESIETDSFVPVRWHGKAAYRGKRIRFDDERNWHLVEALLSQTEVPVQYIFTHPTIRKRLLRTARRLRVPTEIRERVRRVMLRAGTSNPHRNHFHVRVYCDPGDVPGCRDRGVVWKWVPDAFLGDPRTVRAKL